MKFRVIFTIGCAMAAFLANGRHLTADEALQRVAASHPAQMRAISGSPAAKFALKQSVTVGAEVEAQVYVFADAADGYLVTSADDAAPALLGYGTGFDAADMPPAFDWWLRSYADQLAYMLENHIEYRPLATSHPVISNLVATTWNQSAPYNNMCPSDAGGRCVTGCVATATAQVVNYHKIPATHGSGTHSYTWNTQTLSFDYGSTTFDWANMADSYKSSYTTAQASAVATLMYACGVGVNMKYSSSSSGAHTFMLPYFLYENMGYDKGVSFMQRDYFSADEWDEMIYAELAAARPVIYAGNTGGTNPEGHCFVCDGYDGNGYYHINWGWGGTADGTFLLSALNPPVQGIGGASGGGGFNYDQDAIIGLKAPSGSDSTPQLPLYANGGFAYNTDYEAFYFGKNGDSYNGYFNYSPLNVTFQTGVKLVSDSGNVIYVAGSQSSLSGYSSTEGFRGSVLLRISFPSDLPEGDYKAYPVARYADSDLWQPIYVPAADTQYVAVKVNSAGGVGIDGAEPPVLSDYLTVSNIYQNGDIILSSSPAMLVTFVNSSSAAISNNFDFYFYPAGSDSYTRYGTFQGISSDPGKANYSLGLGSLKVSDGKYMVRAYNTSYNGFVSDEFPIYIGIRPKAVSVSAPENNLFVGQTMKLASTVTPADAFDTSVAWTSDNEDVATVDSEGLVKGIAAGSATMTATTVNGLTSNVTLQVNGITGVENVSVDADCQAEYFDIRGIRVAEPTPGAVYIRREGATARVVRL